jgi:hypothetical protein
MQNRDEMERQAALRDIINQQQDRQKVIDASLGTAESIRKGDLDPSQLAPPALKILSSVYDVNSLAPTPDERLGKVMPKITADTGDTQLQGLLDEGKINTAPDQTPAGEMFPSGQGPVQSHPLGDDPALPSTPLQPVPQKPWIAATKARDEALTAVKAAAARKASEAGDVSKAQAVGRATGEHEMFPTTSADTLSLEKSKTEMQNQGRVNLEKQLTPIFAGRAGAEARARLGAEWDPNIVAKKLDFARQSINIDLLKTRRIDQAKEVDNVVNSLMALNPRVRELIELSDQVNTASNSLFKVPGRIGNVVEGKLQTSTAAGKLATLQDSIALGMANSIGGNKGQVSENDKNAMKSLLPGPFDTKEMADSKKESLKLLFEVMPQAIAASDLNSTPADRLAKATQMLEEKKAQMKSSNELHYDAQGKRK